MAAERDLSFALLKYAALRGLRLWRPFDLVGRWWRYRRGRSEESI